MRSNVYIRAGNDRRDTSVGGRGGSDSGYAWINTDNGTKSDCGIRVSAEVVGEKYANGKPRKTCHRCGHKWVEGHYDTPDGRWAQNAQWVPEEGDLKECPQCGAMRQGTDTRKSCFTVTLPEQTDENCEVRITTPHERAAEILKIGAMLVTVQGVMQQAQGADEKKPELVKAGKVRIKQAMKLLEEAEADANQKVPNVILPGGITLAHALACVRLVNEMVEGKAHSKN